MKFSEMLGDVYENPILKLDIALRKQNLKVILEKLFYDPIHPVDIKITSYKIFSEQCLGKPSISERFCKQCGKKKKRSDMLLLRMGAFCSSGCASRFKLKVNGVNCKVCGKRTLSLKYCSRDCLKKDKVRRSIELSNSYYKRRGITKNG